MRLHGEAHQLDRPHKRKYIATTNSNHNLPVALNVSKVLINVRRPKFIGGVMVGCPCIEYADEVPINLSSMALLATLGLTRPGLIILPSPLNGCTNCACSAWPRR
jgi:hypothetical protein